MFRTALLLALASVGSGCVTDYWSQKADQEVFSILGEKRERVLGLAEVPFDIDTPYSAEDADEIAALRIIRERQASDELRLGLKEALEIGTARSRPYQFQKESLYLAGLELTGVRQDFTPLLQGGSTARLNETYREGQGGADSINRSGSVRSGVEFDLLLKTGGRLAVDLAQDIFRFYLGGRPPGGSTRFLAASLTQPLLRGAGSEVAAENLTQAERNVAYAIRDFSRFQQRFALDIITAFYRILQEKDRVKNEYFNYRSIILFRERAEALSQDRLPRFQVDQARQDELRAKNRYIQAIESYRRRVDDFKIRLGLPLQGELYLRDDVLADLNRIGLLSLRVQTEGGFELATTRRLDLLNEIDRFEDSQRRIRVAANAFQPGLDLFAGLDLDTNLSRSGTRYSNFDADTYRTRVGVDLDLPLDNLDERNAYRRTRIAFERQLRALSLALDQIQNEIRGGLRNLELVRQRYEIQRNAFALAQRRVEAVDLLLEAGRAETRDLLEARNDLLQARNSLTAALIDSHLFRLELLFDLGILDIEPDDFWLKNPNISPKYRKPASKGPVTPSSEEPDFLTPEELFQESE
ncbi:MAG: TolC family protein [Verrucomicrobiota bacterium]